MSRHVIDTTILQELVDKVKTLPYEQVAELLNKTIANAQQVVEKTAQVEPAQEAATPASE